MFDRDPIGEDPNLLWRYVARLAAVVTLFATMIKCTLGG